jgi:hypothetical protein
MSDFLNRLLASAGDVRISRVDLELLTEHLNQGIPDATDEQFYHLETIRLYNLGWYRYQDEGCKDRAYLVSVHDLNKGRQKFLRQRETNKVFDKLYATAGQTASDHEDSKGEKNDRSLGPAAEMPPNAVKCSQSQLARSLDMAERGGLVEVLEEAGMISFRTRPPLKLWVVLRNEEDHVKLKKLVEDEKVKRKKSRKPRRSVE